MRNTSSVLSRSLRASYLKCRTTKIKANKMQVSLGIHTTCESMDPPLKLRCLAADLGDVPEYLVLCSKGVSDPIKFCIKMLKRVFISRVSSPLL